MPKYWLYSMWTTPVGNHIVESDYCESLKQQIKSITKSLLEFARQEGQKCLTWERHAHWEFLYFPDSYIWEKSKERRAFFVNWSDIDKDSPTRCKSVKKGKEGNDCKWAYLLIQYSIKANWVRQQNDLSVLMLPSAMPQPCPVPQPCPWPCP